MAGFTNRGKYLMVRSFFQAQDTPASFEVHLVTSATAPAADHNTLSQLTEIADGNGYTQSTGYALTKDTSDFDVATEDDSGDQAYVQIKDVTWTAVTGSIPASGDGARYAVLTTPDSGAANKKIIAFWDLTADRTVSVGQSLTLQNCQLTLAES